MHFLEIFIMTVHMTTPSRGSLFSAKLTCRPSGGTFHFCSLSFGLDVLHKHQTDVLLLDVKSYE